MTEAGREFQVVGAAQLNGRLSMAIRLKGKWSSGISDDFSARCSLWMVPDEVPLQ